MVWCEGDGCENDVLFKCVLLYLSVRFVAIL